ncbi:hypothetical protein DNU06_01800 [Putridiphycobacter roseus]|uniref:Transcription regulator BetR N-terminal domain-containing protein n=1 Tax=Putridiphycobacter roseus TaxID=2219161 RepID=A0A2W1N1T6_9FLAO|nr:hypothetical protein [Putridiphycobacter roseus]PZE18589.1 hypothetical protein DNU06_01800 [Putridiphycobacter roseus]
MINQLDIQEALLKKVETRLPENVKLVEALMDVLHVSQDAAYRRMSGKVPLTIYETQMLLDTYDVNIGNLGSYKKDKIIFDYRPLSRINFNFESYLTGLRDSLREIKHLENPELTISINETPVFQLFNFPHLTRFKFFFWAKSYLQIPEYVNAKFKREKIDKRVLSIGIEAHNLYNSFPSTEMYCPETLRGILRQIDYYFEAGVFEDAHYALELLDNLSGLGRHIEKQAELGHKFAANNEPNDSEQTAFKMYFLDTYLPDNTYYVTHEQGALTYFSHNIMNFIMTQNPEYNADTKMILDRLLDNSTKISVTGHKERAKFFNALEKAIDQLRKKIAFAIEQEEN